MGMEKKQFISTDVGLFKIHLVEDINILEEF